MGKESGQYPAGHSGYGFVCQIAQDKAEPLYLYGAVWHLPCAFDYGIGIFVSFQPSGQSCAGGGDRNRYRIYIASPVHTYGVYAHGV